MHRKRAGYTAFWNSILSTITMACSECGWRLHSGGISVRNRRLQRVMKENDWLHERKRRPKGLTKASDEAMLAEDLIRQDFKTDRPVQKLLTDITQVQCADGKLYISPILDCFNGENSGAVYGGYYEKGIVYRYR
jgi:transposase InsO family protein